MIIWLISTCLMFTCWLITLGDFRISSKELRAFAWISFCRYKRLVESVLCRLITGDVRKSRGEDGVVPEIIIKGLVQEFH